MKKRQLIAFTSICLVRNWEHVIQPNDVAMNWVSSATEIDDPKCMRGCSVFPKHCHLRSNGKHIFENCTHGQEHPQESPHLVGCFNEKFAPLICIQSSGNSCAWFDTEAEVPASRANIFLQIQHPNHPAIALHSEGVGLLNEDPCVVLQMTTDVTSESFLIVRKLKRGEETHATVTQLWNDLP